MRSVQQPGERPCTLRPSTTCSPSQVFTIVFYEKVFLKNQQICVVQGPCCTESCQLRYGVKCRDDNGCRDAAFCDGTGPRCPPSNNKANKTVCNEEFVCFMGVSFSLFTFDDVSWFHFLTTTTTGVHGIDLHRLRPSIVSVPTGTQRPAHQSLRALLQVARRRSALFVSQWIATEVNTTEFCVRN